MSNIYENYAQRIFGKNAEEVLEISHQLRDNARALPVFDEETIAQFDAWLEENIPTAPLQRSHTHARHIRAEFSDALGEKRASVVQAEQLSKISTSGLNGINGLAELLNPKSNNTVATDLDSQLQYAQLELVAAQNQSGQSDASVDEAALQTKIASLTAAVNSRRVVAQVLALNIDINQTTGPVAQIIDALNNLPQANDHLGDL